MRHRLYHRILVLLCHVVFHRHSGKVQVDSFHGVGPYLFRELSMKIDVKHGEDFAWLQLSRLMDTLHLLRLFRIFDIRKDESMEGLMKRRVLQLRFMQVIRVQICISYFLDVIGLPSSESGRLLSH